MNGAETRLNINGGIIRQTTGIAVNTMDGAAVTISGIAALEGKICMTAGTNSTIILDGGTITASQMGIQATPEDASTTEILAHAGTITSENVSIYAKKLTLDPAEGKTITLEGELNLAEDAVITEGTQVLTNDNEVTELRRFDGVVIAKRKAS